MDDRNLIDVQNIFHLMEQRTLKAGYKFYCGKDLENAHEAMADVDATYQVFLAQLDKYKGAVIENKEGMTVEPVVNDMDHLHITSRRHRNADMMGRIIFNDKNEETFNFGKHKGKTLEAVYKNEPGYFGWMMNGDFPLYTKKVLRDVKNRITGRR
jgi:DNA polymerase-3 subunit epsilon